MVLAARLPFALLALVLGAAAGGATPAGTAYQLAQRDLIAITVFDEAELSTETRIDASGKIQVPLLGEVLAGGLSVAELEERLEAEFIAQEYLRAPQVTVTIREYSPKEVLVMGEVRSPGKIVFPMEVNEMGIVDVIGLAGGFTNLARANSVVITRTSPTGERTVERVDVRRLLRSSDSLDPAADVRIRAGDVIFVDERLL